MEIRKISFSLRFFALQGESATEFFDIAKIHRKNNNV